MWRRISAAAREASAGSGTGFGSRRLNTRPSVCLNKELENDLNPKGGILPSLMPHILNRYAPIVVIIFAALLTFACSSNSDNPREKANQAVAKANQQIAEHNKLFNQSRDTYTQVKDKLESGDDPEKQKEQITEASDTLKEARGHLQDARDSLNGVANLKDLDPAVKRYVRLLSQAMDAQLSAEAKELEFYDVLENDPALEGNREKALDLLSEVDEDYKQAENAYAQARDLASSNSSVIALPKETTSSSAFEETTGSS